VRRLRIKHLTTYEYTAAVELLQHKLLLRPREGHDIRIESSRLQISPSHRIQWHRDVNDNCVAIVDFLEPDARITFLSEVLIEHYEESPLDFLIEPSAARFPFHYNPAESTDLRPYEMPVFPADSASIDDWIVPLWPGRENTDTYGLLDRINKSIAETITYQIREEPGVQSPAETLAKKSGSCRDMATLFIEACRRIGLAARFVSGYLHAPISEAGHGATHAWSEIYLPGAGWKGFDSTIGEVTGNCHIAVAVNRHPEAVPPVAGAFIGAADNIPVMRVELEVIEMPEAAMSPGLQHPE